MHNTNSSAEHAGVQWMNSLFRIALKYDQIMLKWLRECVFAEVKRLEKLVFVA